YGADLVPRATLAALVREVAEVPGLRWVRLSSLLPAYFTPELLEVVTGSPVVAPHFHIPLQSGSDRILKAMRRPYNVEMYRRLIERLATVIPQLGLGADLITGFPGESGREFDETVALVDGLPFSYLHVFPYSARKGTEAAGIADTVDEPTIARRARVLRELGRRKNVKFRARARDRRRARAYSGGAGDRMKANDPTIGIIGGSGLYELEGLTDVRWRRVRTPFGAPSDAYCVGRFAGRRVIFLPRHGRGHRI